MVAPEVVVLPAFGQDDIAGVAGADEVQRWLDA
jgi:hypothetical protein